MATTNVQNSASTNPTVAFRPRGSTNSCIANQSFWLAADLIVDADDTTQYYATFSATGGKQNVPENIKHYFKTVSATKQEVYIRIHGTENEIIGTKFTINVYSPDQPDTPIATNSTTIRAVSLNLGELNSLQPKLPNGAYAAISPQKEAGKDFYDDTEVIKFTIDGSNVAAIKGQLDLAIDMYFDTNNGVSVLSNPGAPATKDKDDKDVPAVPSTAFPTYGEAYLVVLSATDKSKDIYTSSKGVFELELGFNDSPFAFSVYFVGIDSARYYDAPTPKVGKEKGVYQVNADAAYLPVNSGKSDFEQRPQLDDCCYWLMVKNATGETVPYYQANASEVPSTINVPLGAFSTDGKPNNQMQYVLQNNLNQAVEASDVLQPFAIYSPIPNGPDLSKPRVLHMPEILPSLIGHQDFIDYSYVNNNKLLTFLAPKPIAANANSVFGNIYINGWDSFRARRVFSRKDIPAQALGTAGYIFRLEDIQDLLGWGTSQQGEFSVLQVEYYIKGAGEKYDGQYSVINNFRIDTVL